MSPNWRDPKRLAKWGAVLAGVAGIGIFVAKTTAPPAEPPKHGPNWIPSFTIDPPEGWTISTTPPRAAELRHAGRELQDSVLTIVVQRAGDAGPIDTEKLAGVLASELEKRGLTVTPPTPDNVAGLPAHLVISKDKDRELCSWIVKRSETFTASVQCGAHDPYDPPACRTACQAPLARLRWLSAE